MKKYSAEVANNILIMALGNEVKHNLKKLKIPNKIPASLTVYTGSKRKSENFSNGIVIMEMDQKSVLT